ncbi:MAG: N-acetylmuramoyl-L-alanine amidase [Acutalibacteraceae bacterium]
MPTIYLSPSLQEWNPYVDGGNEEYYMNLIADAMVPYLNASGIGVVRNNPEMTLRQAINQSNSGSYDLHLALHSNAAPESLKGKLQGADVYYYPTSAKGKRAAEIIAENYKKIYPYPDKVTVRATTSLGELRQTKAPAVLFEVAYHDNPEEAKWIRDNIGVIAKNISESVAQYLGVPFVDPYQS